MTGKRDNDEHSRHGAGTGRIAGIPPVVVYRKCCGIFRYLDRQHPVDHHHARYLFGLGEGAPQPLFLRQHGAARPRLRISCQGQADPHRAPDRPWLSGGLQYRPGGTADCWPSALSARAVLLSVADHARPALQRPGHQLSQCAFRLRWPDGRRVRRLHGRSGHRGAVARSPCAACQPLDVPLPRQQSALWRPCLCGGPEARADL
jgi:hypothetical protein